MDILRKEFIQKLKAVFDKDLNKTWLTVEYLAQNVFNTHVRSLNRQCHEYLGRPMQQVIIRSRVWLAVRLIKSDPYLILATLHESVGYKKRASLEGVFEEYKGIRMEKYAGLCAQNPGEAFLKLLKNEADEKCPVCGR
ncbi:MAG: hypothetical protein IPP77_11380 [Bacteroidetes bacterium]|nr:hypothetical protein [Bacteroidota bacterium]